MMLVKGNHVIKIRLGNGVVTKAYIIYGGEDFLIVRTATGFDYTVRAEPSANNYHEVIG